MQIILASASRRRQDWLQKHLDSISDISISTRALLTEESELIIGKDVGEQTEATCLFKARAAVMEWIIISQSGEENGGLGRGIFSVACAAVIDQGSDASKG